MNKSQFKNINKDYTLGKQLGRGTWGVVRLGHNNLTNEQVAIKIADRDNCVKFFTEIEILKNCDHPNIVKYIDNYQDDRCYYLVMEYLPFGELYKYIENQSIDEYEARIIFIQLLNAIEYCHNMSIAHLDIKLENILISNKTEDHDKIIIKLIDFGMSFCGPSETLINLFCGSLHYCCPEIIKKQTYNPFKADIWSMGTVLYIMLVGRFPRDNSEKELSSYDYDVTSLEDIATPHLVDLIKKIFKPQTERITLDKIKNHSWLTGCVINTYPITKTHYEINTYIVNRLISAGYTEYFITKIFGKNNKDIVEIYLSIQNSIKKIHSKFTLRDSFFLCKRRKLTKCNSESSILVNSIKF